MTVFPWQSHSDIPDTHFAGYRILAECGQGAYGRVFLAEDALGRRCAVKYLPNAQASEYELRGLRNYLSVSATSDALLRIFHCGLDDHGCLFYVMEAADNAAPPGQPYLPDTLARRLEASPRLPLAEVMSLAHSLLDGLDCLHAAGFLHRDIKPENIIFVDGRPKLGDPGLTRQFEETLSVSGTPGYIPPEFYVGKTKGSPASDLYALGKLLYRVATGNSPDQYPLLPRDMPAQELYKLCRPLTHLCNSLPEKRCRTCAEARKILDRAARDRHGAFHQFWDSLMLFPERRRRFALGCGLTLLVLGILGLAMANVVILRRNVQRQERQERKLRHKLLTSRLERLQEIAPALDQQISEAGGVKCQESLRQMQSLLQSGAFEATERQFGEFCASLVEIARQRLPADISSSLLATGRGWGYLASPLGERFLPAMVREDFAHRLQQASQDYCPVPGQDFLEPTAYLLNFVFIPPSWFHSVLDQRLRDVFYPYWLCATEVSISTYSYFTNLEPSMNNGEGSVEYLSWNDALLFCHNLTMDTAVRWHLPQGYAFRPPTEAEWECAALGGWRNEAPPTRQIPAGTPKRLSGESDSAKHRGLFNIDDNLSELVEPYPDLPLPLPDEVVTRGARYRQSQTSLDTRIYYVKDQIRAPGSAGLRPVLGPVAEDYFDKAWWRGPTMATCVRNNAVFLGFSTVLAAMGWHEARQLAEDLGASLPDEPQDMKGLYQQLHLQTAFPCHLGIRAADGHWRRLRDGQVVSAPGLPEITAERPCLSSTAFTVHDIGESTIMPVLILRWEDEQAYRQRLETFLQRARLASFEYEGRHFALCRCGHFTGYAVRPFLKALGARQPLFQSPEFLQALLERLPDEEYCALGPIRFYNGWEQADGSPLFDISEHLQPNTSRSSHVASPSLAILAAHHGKLLPTGQVTAFLLELTP